MTGSTTDNEPPYNQSLYNAKGQPWKQRDPDDVITLLNRDLLGEQTYSIQALSTTARGWTSYGQLGSAIGGSLLTSGNADRITQTKNIALVSGASGNTRGADLRQTEQ